MASQAHRGRHGAGVGGHLPRWPRGAARRRALARARRQALARGAADPGRRPSQRRALGGSLHRREAGAHPVEHPGVGRPLRRLARRAGAQGRVRPARPQRRAQRGRVLLRAVGRPRQGRGQAPPDRGGRGDRHRSARCARPRAARARRVGPGAQRGHRAAQPPRDRRRPHARALRLLVRALPALVGRLQGRRGAGSGHRRAGLRRPLHAADPPDRPHQPQGPQQHPHARAGRSRQPVRHRRRDRGPRRHPPRARHRRGVPRARRHGQRARHRHRAGPRDQLLARPPVAQGAPRVVLPPPRRHAQVRREPAQEVPGHLQRQLRVRRLAQPLGRAAGRRAPLGRSRREGLPRRQPAHEALRLLGVAHQGDPRDRPRRDLPGRGLHPPLGHARAGQDRLHAELHVLHVEELPLGARRVPQRARPRPRARVLPPQLLPHHAGHPHRLPGRGRPAGLPDPPHPGRHAEPQLRRLLGLRALRAHPAPGQRGVPRQREVRAQAARARRPAAGDDPAPELRAPREPRAPAPGQHRLPRRRQRRDHRLRQARRGRTPSSAW